MASKRDDRGRQRPENSTSPDPYPQQRVRAEDTSSRQQRSSESGYRDSTAQPQSYYPAKRSLATPASPHDPEQYSHETHGYFATGSRDEPSFSRASSPSAGTRTSGGSVRVSFPYAPDPEEDVESDRGSQPGKNIAGVVLPMLVPESPIFTNLLNPSTNEPPSGPQTQGSETPALEEGTAGREVRLDPLSATSPYASNPRNTRTQGHSSSFGSPNTPAKASGAQKSKTKGSRTAAPGQSGDPKTRRTSGRDSPSAPLNTLGKKKGASSKEIQVTRPKSPGLSQDSIMRGTSGHDLGSGSTQSYDEAVEREGLARDSLSGGYPPYRPPARTSRDPPRYSRHPPDNFDDIPRDPIREAKRPLPESRADLPRDPARGPRTTETHTHGIPTEVPRDMGQFTAPALGPHQTQGQGQLLGIAVPPRSEWKDQRPPELTKQQKAQLPDQREWTDLEIWITVWGWADNLPWKDVNDLLPNRPSRAAQPLILNLKGNPEFKWAVELREENKKDIEAANAADSIKVYHKKYYQKKREEIKRRDAGKERPPH